MSWHRSAVACAKFGSTNLDVQDKMAVRCLLASVAIRLDNVRAVQRRSELPRASSAAPGLAIFFQTHATEHTVPCLRNETRWRPPNVLRGLAASRHPLGSAPE